MAIESPSSTDDDRQRVYEHLVGFVRQNTGGSIPPLTPKSSAVGSLCRSGRHPDEVNSAMTAACANGDLFRWCDDRDDRLYLALDDVDALLERIGEYCQRADEPRRDLIGIANQRVQYLRGEDGE